MSNGYRLRIILKTQTLAVKEDTIPNCRHEHRTPDMDHHVAQPLYRVPGILSSALNFNLSTYNTCAPETHAYTVDNIKRDAAERNANTGGG